MLLAVSFLMFSHAFLVRSSMSASELVHRLRVLSPSVSRINALSRSEAGADASVKGAPVVKACHPQTMPIVTLVLPFGTMLSILALSVSQDEVNGSIDTGHGLAWCAGN